MEDNKWYKKMKVSSFNQLQIKESGKAEGTERAVSIITSIHHPQSLCFLWQQLTNFLGNWSVELPRVKYRCSELRHVCIQPAFLQLSASVYKPVNTQIGKGVISKNIWHRILSNVRRLELYLILQSNKHE